MRVLVIDDEPDVLLLCRVNFELAGHEVFEAPNGELGLELARREHPDVIVLDVMLPVRDGLSILDELLSDPRTAGTPVVLLTAKTQIQDRLEGWRAGCSEYVTKPFSPVALAELVEQVAEMGPAELRAHRHLELGHLDPSS
jgi:two-component system, OmpR family, phosphate regulon response regulator PhoB